MAMLAWRGAERPGAGDMREGNDREWDGWEMPLEAEAKTSASGEVPPDTAPSVRRFSTRGRRALVIAVIVAAASVLWSVCVAFLGTRVMHAQEMLSTGSQWMFFVNVRMHPDLVASGMQILLGTVFGVWAFVQGILAVVRKDGAKWGTAAIVIAGAAPILSLAVWFGLGAVFGQDVTMQR